MRKIAFTSITNNYLPKARALAHSIKRHSKDVTFVLLLAEDVNESLLRPDDPFDSFLTVTDLGISPLEPWLFCHTVVEVCTAIKGPAMLKLLSSNEDCAVLYFDPDMIVTSSLDPLFASFDDHASILLTPHVTQPATTLDEILDNEISPLRYGVYNLGFLGVRNSSSGLRFADWWAKRLHDFCYEDIDNGIFTDQRWVDLAPAMFEGVSILRDPGYNVATWNLAHRVVTGSIEGGLSVNGCPLVFYHFSGFDSGAQEMMLDKYGQQSPVLKDFREWYIDECRRLGQDQIGTLPWTYSKFDNDQPITTVQRKLYRNREDLQRAFPNPFSTEKLNESYFQWYLHNSEQPGSAVLSGSTCRILVLALEGGPDQIDSLRELVGKTARPSAIEVVATRAVREKLVQALPALRFLDISYLDAAAEEREFWILNKIIESQEDGLIFIQLGLRVPDFWDLRLQWGAGQEPTVLTVSPLYNGVSMTSPVNPGEASLPAPPGDIDRTVFNSNCRIPIDAPTFLYECFFINETIARSLAERFRISCTINQQRPRLAEFARYCTGKGFSHVIANNVYVGTNPICGHIDLIKRAHDADVETYLPRNALWEIRTHLKNVLSNDVSHTPSISQRAARRNLHVMHSWGGGLEHWVRSFCRSDNQHVNMVLKSVWNMSGFSTGLALYASIDDPAPIAQWCLPIPIKATVPSNLSYQRIIRSIVRDYGIDVVFVSTLIGHSMDVLKTDAATILICHDHFPLTPEIYIRSCDLSGNRITDFSVGKVYDRGAPTVWFPKYSRSEAQLAQKAFREILASGIIKLVTPSPSTRRICLDLAPELNPLDISVIPNGIAPNILAATLVPYQSSGKLRIVILGRMCPEKGSALLETVILKLTEMADILLLGGAHQGLSFANIPGVRAIVEYEHDRLPELLEEFEPHLGLLLSNVPETFSYTLGELLALGIPPVAVRIGSLADRITDGVNGFLFDNSPDALIDILKALDQDRTQLESVRKTLETGKHRTEPEMVQDYELLLGMPRYSQCAFNGHQLPSSAYERIPMHPAPGELQPLSQGTNGATIAVDPNPVTVSDGSGLGIATVSYTFPEGQLVEVHVGSPNGQLFCRPADNGTATTGKWVSDGMIFFLQDVTNGNALTYEHTLATASARLVAVKYQDEITSPIKKHGHFFSSLMSLFSRNSSSSAEQVTKGF